MVADKDEFFPITHIDGAIDVNVVLCSGQRRLFAVAAKGNIISDVEVVIGKCDGADSLNTRVSRRLSRRARLNSH